jgi:hypothetical protein
MQSISISTAESSRLLARGESSPEASGVRGGGEKDRIIGDVIRSTWAETWEETRSIPADTLDDTLSIPEETRSTPTDILSMLDDILPRRPPTSRMGGAGASRGPKMASSVSATERFRRSASGEGGGGLGSADIDAEARPMNRLPEEGGCGRGCSRTKEGSR